MTTSPDQKPARPELALRLGITGARSLRADQIARIECELEHVIVRAKTEMERLARQEMVAPFYEKKKDEKLHPHMNFVSPLAKGGDRLAAKVALKHRYKLCVPMPFEQHEYERDFTGRDDHHPEETPLTAEEDLREFHELLDCADSLITLDGGRSPDSDDGVDINAQHAYEVVGRFVVRHCDLLIAIWDGKPGNGRGGTADIVHYAATAGVPVWWIHATEQRAPRWLRDLLDLRDEEPSEEPAHTRLTGHLNLLVPPPPPAPHEHKDWIRRLASPFRRHRPSQITVYLQEKEQRPFFLWKSYKFATTCAIGLYDWSHRVTQWLLSIWRWLRHMLSILPPEPPKKKRAEKKDTTHADQQAKSDAHLWPDQRTQAYWHNLYSPANTHAIEYAARYRSGYVLVILMATLALISGAVAYSPFVHHFREQVISEQRPVEEHPKQSGFTSEKVRGYVAAAAELSTLAMVLGLVGLTSLNEWHEKSIDYRLLAELFRKQQALSALGWQLPIGNLQNLSDTDRLSWVTWLFAAAQRAAPMPRGSLASEEHRLASQEVLLALVDEQIGYHESRERTSHKSAATFESLGSWIFIAVLVCVGFKIAGEYEEWDDLWIAVLGLMAIILPGISAAFVGIRSYAELQLLAEQSKHMVHELERARRRVERLKLYRPSVSQDLGTEGLAVALLMLQDLEGWGRLFRGKSTEAA